MFVNCLVKQFEICFGVVAILLLNVMAVFRLDGGAITACLKPIYVEDLYLLATQCL